MAIGDSNNILLRIKALIPGRWFAWVAPYRDALLGGISDSAAWSYSLITYARLQIRLKTATGIWLDIASRDFLGINLPRRTAEADPIFSARLIKEVLRPRNTRAAILQMLLDLTGTAGTVQEPWNPRDWGGYGLSNSGYGVAIGYGSLQLRNQIFVQAVRPSNSGIPNVAGYGTVAGGYGVGRSEYGDLSQVQAPVTDAEIYLNITRTIAAGITAWTDIISSGTQTNGTMVLLGTQSAAMGVLQDFWF